ncbi:hypothetical protein MBANPS3_001479 [Mucor bainieri]
MEEILHYSQYDYLLCFDADEHNLTYITGSSNRAISAKKLIDVNTSRNNLPSFKQSTFLECFELLSKEKQNTLSKYDKSILASVRNLFKKIKEELSEEHGVSLETAQLLFVMPLGWTEEYCKDKLCAFFQDVGWVTPKDNKIKLVTIPYIQLLTEHFQRWTNHLDRERTSVLFHIQKSWRSEGWIDEFSYTFFKMQSAKELMAVSKKLASSDFLLVPSIGDTTSINLANIEDIVYNVVKKIIAGTKQGKHSRRVSDEGNTDEGNTDEENTDEENTDEENTDEEDGAAWFIADDILQLQEDMLERDEEAMEDYDETLEEYDETLEEYFQCEVDFEDQFQDLGKWTCRQLLAAIYEDIDVKHYLKQVGDFFRGAIDEYGAVRDSPDGIQHILLYDRYHKNVHFHWNSADFIYQRSVIEEGIIPPGKEFMRFGVQDDTQFAMQQSHKMIQIANAVLPPVIVDDEGQNDPKLPTCKPTDNLIAPNSFYVQANVTETQISFILNKVIEVSPSNTGIDLFTVQERAIEMENIADTASYLLWNHYQAMNDIEEQQHGLFERCQDHDTMVLLSSHYKEFSKNASGLIKSWFATEDHTLFEEKLGTYHLVSVDQQCSCSLKLSQRLLMEVGLKPAIANIATTITSALFSDDYFGLYQPSALILERNFETIKNLPFSCAINGLLKQALKTFLQLHHNRLLLLFHDDCAKSSFSQYLGWGEFSQISSAAYIFSVRAVYKKGDEPIFGVLLKDGTCKKLPHVYRSYRWMDGDDCREYEFTYLILAKEENLPLNGTANTSDLVIEVYVLDNSKDSTSQRRQVGTTLTIHLSYPTEPLVFMSVLPVHYSSTLKFVTTWIVRGWGDSTLIENPIEALERLYLKRNYYIR